MDNIPFCKHVYTHIDAAICPLCGRDTHNINWVAEAQRHKEWIASGKATYQGWWSI